MTIDSHINLCSEKISTILNQHNADTQATIVNMLAYSQFPIDGHDEVSQIVSTLISAINGAAKTSTNPIIVAAGAVQEIWTVVHGQANDLAQSAHMHIEETVALLTSEILEILQQDLMQEGVA